MSGRREPRTGGVIIARAGSEDAINAVIREGPFYQNTIAEYAIMDFRRRWRVTLS